MRSGPAIRALLGAALAVAGCAESSGTVSIYGYLFTSPVIDSETQVLGGASVDAYDLGGALLAEGYEPSSDAPGYYRVAGLPPDERVVLVAAAPGDWVATLHAGRTRSSSLYLNNGELFILPLDTVRTYLEAWERAEPEGPVHDLDPETDGNGGFIVGQLADPERWAGTRIHAETSDGQEVPAMYFADTGLPEKSLTESQADGRFAIFGLPAGPVKVWFTLPGEDEPLPEPFETLIAEDAVTSLIGFRITEES